MSCAKKYTNLVFITCNVTGFFVRSMSYDCCWSYDCCCGVLMYDMCSTYSVLYRMDCNLWRCGSPPAFRHPRSGGHSAQDRMGHSALLCSSLCAYGGEGVVHHVIQVMLVFLCIVT